MKRTSVALLLVCLVAVAAGQDYEGQDAWGGDCQTGEQQSP